MTHRAQTPSQSAHPPAGSNLANTSARTTKTKISKNAPNLPEPSKIKSNLTKQNNAFAHTIKTKRRRTIQKTLSTFETFMTRYPSSALVESALSERMKLLHMSDPNQTPTTARQYLLR